MFKRIIWHCVFPLLAGFIIYLFFHQPNLQLHQWLAAHFSVPNFYSSIKNHSLVIFLLNHVPDALWDYSLTCFLLLCVSTSVKKYARAALIISVVSLTEIIQLFFPKQFTFDWTDLFIAIIISLLTLTYSAYEKKNIV